MARYRIPAGVTFQAQTPIAQAISNLGNIFASLPTAEERAFNAARAASTQAEAALRQNQLNAASSIGDVFRRALTPPEGVDPAAHFRNSIPELATVAANANQYGQIGEFGRVAGANMAGTTPEITTRAMLGAGSPMSATPVGEANTLANRTQQANIHAGATLAAQRYASDRAAATQEAIANRTLVPTPDGNGGFRYIRSVDAAGQPAPVPASEATLRGQTAVADRTLVPVRDATGNVTYARAADAVGQPVGARPVDHAPSNSFVIARHPQTGEQRSLRADSPEATALAGQGWMVAPANIQATSATGLTPSQEGTEAQAQSHMLNFADLVTRAYALSRDPTAMGPAGAIRGFVQDATAAIDGMTQLMPESVRQQYQQTRDAAARATATGRFDPSLSQLNSLFQILPYAAAQALASQEGRGVSDTDVRNFQRMAGTENWLNSPQDFGARAQLMMDIVRDRVNRSRALTGRPPIDPGAFVLGGGAPAPAGGTPAAAAPPRRIRLNPDGSIRQ